MTVYIAVKKNKKQNILQKKISSFQWITDYGQVPGLEWMKQHQRMKDLNCVPLSFSNIELQSVIGQWDIYSINY
jgi:hypothetical protein